MTPHNKAVNAVNARLERLQANLQQAQSEPVQRILFQALVVTIASAEVLNDYIKAVGAYAQRRHAEVKQENDRLAVQHAEFLKSGQELLEKLKTSPTDRALRKDIERVQRSMAAVQKSLRRGANALQREFAPSLGMVDEMAVSVRRLTEADDVEDLKRVLKTIVDQVRGYYAAHELPAKNLVDAPTWEKSATVELERAAGFHDAYARAGNQLVLAVEFMIIALSENPPRTPDEVTQRGLEAVAARLKEITGRFTAAPA
jgi:hypothetical protein